MRDVIRNAAMYKRDQLRVFETLINLYAAGLSINPEIGKKVEELSKEYLEIIMPGTKQKIERDKKSFVAKNTKALEKINDVLSRWKSKVFKK